MKISDLDVNKDYLLITDLENIFNIYKDNKENYFYNLNSTIYFNIPDEKLNKYICSYEMHWPLISYKLYETTRLAWFLMKLNNVQAKDVFKTKQPGDIIRYLEKQTVINIITKLNGF